MRRSRIRRIGRAAKEEMAEAIRSRRRSMPTTVIGRELMNDDGRIDFRATRTVEPIMNDRRERWAWEVRGQVGPRRSYVRFDIHPMWHPGPLVYSGIASSGMDADIDAREVEAVMRSHYSRLIGVPEPMVVQSR